MSKKFSRLSVWSIAALKDVIIASSAGEFAYCEMIVVQTFERGHVSEGTRPDDEGPDRVLPRGRSWRVARVGRSGHVVENAMLVATSCGTWLIWTETRLWSPEESETGELATSAAPAEVVAFEVT